MLFHRGKKIAVRSLAATLSVLMLAQTPVLADVPLKDKFQQSAGGEFEYNQSAKYAYYKDVLKEYEEYGYQPYSGDPITLGAPAVESETGKAETITLENKEAMMWKADVNSLEWTIKVEKSGLYSLQLDYYLPDGVDADAIRMLYVDGVTPFYEANNIKFECLWRESGEVRVNSLGDDVWPSQEAVRRWITKSFSDPSGLYSYPFTFYFKEGEEHKVKLEYVYGDMAIGDLRLMPAEQDKTYAEVKAEYDAKGYKEAPAGTQTLQAEDIVLEKNDESIRREYDADPLVVPYAIANRRLNVLGGGRWRQGGQSITLSFNVEQDGLYKLGFHLLQNYNDGLPSHRKIYIDGTVPFEELRAYRFNYSEKWQTETLSDEEGNPYLFYFEKGQHTVTMEVVVSPFTDVVYDINDATLAVSKMIQDITEQTSSDPDPNYDYKLFKYIPDLQERMQAMVDMMQSCYDRLAAMTDKIPAMANNFLSIKAQFEQMIEDPYRIPRRLKDLENTMSQLGSWYQSLQSQSLLLDNLMVGSPSDTWVHKNSSFWSRLWGSIVSFVVSFSKDYDNVGSVLEGEVEITDVIDVWVAYGTDWAEQIKELADTEFTPKSGILINVNILPAGQLNAGSVNALMLSITSGKAPDVSIGTSSTSPSEFAMRGAAVDLSSFSDFEEVKARFLDSIFIPFRYNDGEHTGTYALPDTMNFNVMFYRKDILSELGLSLPQTKEDLYNNTLPVLYQNNMEFFFPQDFSQFLFQHGATYYTEDGMKSALDTPEAFQAFKEYAEIFTNYGVPVSADFYNRFRSGEMPIGISNFRLYMLFTAAAPELVGRWGVAPIPGTLQADGTIDRSAGGLAAECSLILSQSDKQDAAWEFLKWWTSDETQTQFARNIESLVGTEARWNSANIKAFESLAWGKGDLPVIQEYWNWAKEQPVVLGGYFTGRHLNNAWNRVIIDGQSVRDALEEAVYDINRELKMKQEEYGIHVDE